MTEDKENPKRKLRKIVGEDPVMIIKTMNVQKRASNGYAISEMDSNLEKSQKHNHCNFFVGFMIKR